MRVKALESVIQGVSEAAKALDGVLDPSASTHSQTRTQIDFPPLTTHYSIQAARDRLSEALKEAIAECEPLQISGGLPSSANLHHGSSRLEVGSLAENTNEPTGSTSSTDRSRFSGHEYSDQHTKDSNPSGTIYMASTSCGSPAMSQILDVSSRPPSLFVAEEGSSFSTILLWQALVAAHYHLKQFLTTGNSTGLVQSMFSLTIRHESPTDTLRRYSGAIYARYTGRPFREQNYCQLSEQMRLHDLVIKDLLLTYHEDLEDYLDVYQVETYLRHLCSSGGNSGTTAHSTSSASSWFPSATPWNTEPLTSSAISTTHSSSQWSILDSSQQLLSTLIKALALKGVCFGDGPRYRVDVVKEVFGSVLRSQFRMPQDSLNAVDAGSEELSFVAELEGIGTDEYWNDLWDS